MPAVRYPRPPAWAVYDVRRHEWMVDTCAGGVFDTDVSKAVEYASALEASQAIKAAEISSLNLLVLRIR